MSFINEVVGVVVIVLVEAVVEVSCSRSSSNRTGSVAKVVVAVTLESDVVLVVIVKTDLVLLVIIVTVV